MEGLPYVTVQLPVYNEPLEDVIMSTIKSLKKAVTTYERQGGSVGVLPLSLGLDMAVMVSSVRATSRRGET